MSSQSATKSQVDGCYQTLRSLIVTCKLSPGARLTERELIDQLGFGRTPVREALLRLAHDGIVEIKPRSGYQVKPLTRKSVVDFFDVWGVVAPLIAELAVDKLTNEDREEILEIEAKRIEALSVDSVTQSKFARKFFDVLVRVADNEPLTYIYRRLGAELERISRVFAFFPAANVPLGPIDEISIYATMRNSVGAAAIAKGRIQAARELLLAEIDSVEASGQKFLWR